MKSIILTILTSMVLAGAAFADHANDENHEGNDGGTGSSTATAVAVQGQEQFQAQDSSQSLSIEDAKNPAAGAANLYLANCTSGASAQGFGGGGSVGGPDEVCQLLNAALVGQQIGNEEFTKFAIERATALLKERTNFIIRFFQLFPVIRRVI